MKDANLTFTADMPNAGANTITDVVDLGPIRTDNATWQHAYFSVDVPAMANHTNTSAGVTVTMQTSSVNTNANYASSDPVIQISVPGVGSTGSAARTVKVPIPPGVSQYVRFVATATANATTNNGTATFALVVP